VREEILESDPEDLQAWRVWLEWERWKKESSFGARQFRLIQQLPKPEGLLLMARQLLLSEKLPQLNLIQKVFRDHPMKMLDAFKGCVKKSALTLPKVAISLEKSIRVEPEKVLNWMIQRVKEGKLRGVYSLKTSRNLKSSFRGKLFEHHFKEVLMSNALLHKLETQPECFPESTYSLKLEGLRKQACAAWASGDFGESSILEWLRFSKSDVYLERELAKDFLHPDTFREPRTHLKKQTQLELQHLLQKKVFWNFLFMGSEPKKRLELIQSLEPDLQKSWIRNIPAEFLQNMLGSLQQLTECHKAIKLLRNGKSLRRVVNRDFLNWIRCDDLPFERYWHLRGFNHRGLAGVKPCPENALNLLTGLPQDEKFVKKMFCRFSDYDRMPWRLRYSEKESKKKKILTFEKPEHALRWLQPLRLKRLLRGGPVHSRLLRDAVKEVRNSMSGEWLKVHAPNVVKADPFWLAEHFAGELTQKEWQMVSGKKAFWNLPAQSSQLFMKHTTLSRWKEKQWTVPVVLKKVATLDPELASRCLDQNPKIFWDLAKKALPWWERLPHALSHPDQAKLLEKEIPRERWVEGLEKIQSHYPPNIAAAMELALHFGLRYGSFLAQVAKSLKLGLDDSVSGSECDSRYHTYRIPKQSGGTRLITAPSRTLKHFQRALVDLEMNRWPLEPSATGFRPGSSVVENAMPHVGKRLVVNVDLKGFFPNTKFPRILKVLHFRLHGRFSPRAVRLLAVLCSFSGGLPTGAPTSPAIANQVLSSADKSISKAAQHKDVHYTRYADDLTLSGDDHAPVKLLPFVEEVIEKLGYELDPKKTNLFRKGRRQCVTGLVVNQKPNLAKPLRRRLRAAVHHFVHKRPMQWHGRPMNLTQLLGRIGFLAQTQPEEATRLRNLLEG
jgi:retron-type reverse transcriptase